MPPARATGGLNALLAPGHNCTVSLVPSGATAFDPFAGARVPATLSGTRTITQNPVTVSLLHHQQSVFGRVV